MLRRDLPTWWLYLQTLVWCCCALVTLLLLLAVVCIKIYSIVLHSVPDSVQAEKSDVIFFCSPNNPTGAAATRAQLTSLVEAAKKNGSLIVYDAAYALYIEDDDCPKSIFQIPGQGLGCKQG